MTPDEVNPKLEEYCKELYYIQQSFIDFNGLPTLPPAQISKYNTLIVAITDFLNDAFGENRYEPMIKKIHNDCIADGLFEPTHGSINGIISVLRAAIIRVENNPNCTVPKNQHELSEVPNPATTPTDSKPPDRKEQKEWYQLPVGIAGITIFAGVMVILAVYLIKKHFGIPL